jgi:GT2 family glycosyltransferase
VTRNRRADMPAITVAVCTWNRAALLDQTLATMQQLRVPAGLEWELLVVNNNCTDDTDAVIADHSRRLPLRRLFEPKQGHAHARNRALAAAAGELILWTDDDVLVDPQWCAEYVKAADRWPDAVFFGGTISPWFPAQPPRWIRRNMCWLSPYYAILQHGDVVRPLAPGERVFGANMAFRTEVLRQFAFDVRLGRVEDELLSGDDIELIGRVSGAGHRGVWVGTARVRHYIPAERLTGAYLWNWWRGAGRTDVRQHGLPSCKYLWRMPRWVIRKYVEARLMSWCLSPFKGRRWLRAFQSAAYARGVLEESRAKLAQANGRPESPPTNGATELQSR